MDALRGNRRPEGSATRERGRGARALRGLRRERSERPTDRGGRARGKRPAIDGERRKGTPSRRVVTRRVIIQNRPFVRGRRPPELARGGGVAANRLRLYKRPDFVPLGACNNQARKRVPPEGSPSVGYSCRSVTYSRVVAILECPRSDCAFSTDPVFSYSFLA